LVFVFNPTVFTVASILRFQPAQREVLLEIKNPSLELAGEPVSLALDVSGVKDRIARIVAGGKEELLLEIDAEAERQPGVVWEIYVGSPQTVTNDPISANYVGNLVLYGTGIRSEAKPGAKPAHFVFRINHAVQAAWKSGATDHLSLTFAPHGPLVNGRPSHPSVKSAVHLDSLTLASRP
jgi:hypothetical protein